MYALNNNVTYFDSFGVEHIPKEIKIFIDKPIVVANIFRIQAYDLIMCGYFALDLLVLCLQARLQALLIYFHQMNLKRMMIQFYSINV